MSDIVLWRHAEAEDGVPDLERPLTRKGHKQARRMAQWLHKRLPASAVICCSPATRAQQTAQALAHLAAREFVTLAALSPATRLDAALGAIRASDPSRTLVVVGHQPTLGAIVAHLLDTRDPDWPLRKGAIVWLREKETEDGLRVALHTALTPDLA